MKILYYCPEYYSRHGGRSHARGFFKALQSLPELTGSYLYPDAAGSQETVRESGQPKPRPRLWFLPPTVRGIIAFFRPRNALARELVKIISANRCEAVIIRTGFVIPSLRLLKKACPDTTICLEINAAFFVEAYPGMWFRRFFQKLEVMVFNQADILMVVSSHLKEYLEKRGVSPDRIFVNQNGVELEDVVASGDNHIRQEYGIPDNSFLLGYVGGMERFRRLPEVVNAVAALRKEHDSDISLLLVGDGEDMPAVKEAIRENQAVLGGSVICAGWQDHARIREYLSAFDVAIFPFTNDYCSPLKIFEYLAAGVPTIGPDTSAVSEVFTDGVHLRLVKQDGSNFREVVMDLKNHPELRRDLVEKGRKLVVDNYTWKQNAERVVRNIRDARNRRRK